MSDFPKRDIHEAFHRLVLRKRWMRWSIRNYKWGDYKAGTGRHTILSARLTNLAPTWEQLHKS